MNGSECRARAGAYVELAEQIEGPDRIQLPRRSSEADLPGAAGLSLSVRGAGASPLAREQSLKAFRIQCYGLNPSICLGVR
jgi:hypothetical protein